MSDEGTVSYNDGDIVWVKLGSCWWPGEVTDKGPEDISAAKKPPLVIVKFFNEDTFEFVKSYNHIFVYNCERKNEFIRKGMDSFRANNTHMEKFPIDVSLAEVRTDGNPNILSDPIFLPQKRRSIIAEVFGTPVNKKETKSVRARGSSAKSSTKKVAKANITHRRFLGFSDYESHIRVQYPGKDTQHLPAEEIVTVEEEPTRTFPCSSCPFTTTRLEVMVFHVQCHFRDNNEPAAKKSKTSPKKPKKPRLKHITSEDDSDQPHCSKNYSGDKHQNNKSKPKKKRKTEAAIVKEPVTDILAEWDDKDHDDDEDELNNSTIISEDANDIVDKEKLNESKEPTPECKDSRDLLKSCFDFDEEEEEDNSLVHTAVGRKIPRIIPPNEKVQSADLVDEDASLPIAEDDENRMEIIKGSDNSENSLPNEPELSKEDAEFNALMASTVVPELPSLPGSTSKSPQSFFDQECTKMPEKKPETVSEVATKLTNPKKRFVKSFEDFEMLQNEQRKAQEAIEKNKLKDEFDTSTPEPSNENSQPDTTSEKSDVNVSDDESINNTDKNKDSVEDIVEQEPVKPKFSSNVKISKLKCQLRSKMDTELVTPAKKRRSLKPKGKVLEIIKSDKDFQIITKETHSADEESKDTSDIPVEKILKSSPKKSKLSKYKRSKETKELSTKDDSVIEEEPPKVETEETVDLKEELITENVIENDSSSLEAPTESLESTPVLTAEHTDDEKTEDNLSALTTLAMVSELETTNEISKEIEMETEDIIEDVLKSSDSEMKEDEPLNKIQEHFEKTLESELVPIDGNLTVVSEKDLADGQVEITADASLICSKPVTLTTFSMDFSESNSDSLLNEIHEPITNEVEKVEEEQKVVEEEEEKIEEETKEETVEEVLKDLFDVEENIPLEKVEEEAISEVNELPDLKLLNNLTSQSDCFANIPQKEAVEVEKKITSSPKASFFINPTPKLKSPVVQSSKPIILSERIIKPEKQAPSAIASSVSVQKITSKRNMQDMDEIDTFIIQKDGQRDEDDSASKRIKRNPIPESKTITSALMAQQPIRKRGKAKILQQTIITPSGEIIQPDVSQNSSVVSVDDNVFDINSMPIVLSDQILTPESIENMPIFLSDTSSQETVSTPKVQNVVKRVPPTNQQIGMRILNKSISPATFLNSGATDKHAKLLPKSSKIMGSVGKKIIKQNAFSATAGKHGKYVIVSQPSTSTGSKYTVGKRPLVKRTAVESGISPKVQSTAEPSGNKIMILTNQQGHQQRVLLTPAQQKLIGYQTTGSKVAKTIVKGNVIQKSKEGVVTSIAGSSPLMSKSATTPRMAIHKTAISSSSHVLPSVQSSQGKSIRIEKMMPTRKLQMQSQKVNIKPQKTILIKNQHGQTVRKIQGTDDALLDQQVAEQIEAIKASGVLHQKQDVINYKSVPKTMRRSYIKKPLDSPKSELKLSANSPKPEPILPPLAPISPKKQDTDKSDRPLNQLVIQDAMGNQTTITEGQILALPSETIDGQPQSYMLVTLDESGNLTPLNNEALMSLDPNLALGGDLNLGNTVLPIGKSQLTEETVTKRSEPIATTTSDMEVETSLSESIELASTKEVVSEPSKSSIDMETSQEESVIPSAEGDSGQQLIVTGDPIAAQKFLESLTEGSTDLANILANAEGNSILIHADGQQILINTDADNHMLLSVNSDDVNISENTESSGNPIFANQPSKNQDILAAALADTDVFQHEQNGSHKSIQSQLSPSSALYPMNVGVLETSLTLNCPIMTPLEVPSTNNKKVSDESDILSQVPKNVDLPITITDPNISQTVSQQQVANLLASEIQTNLELPLRISDSNLIVTSSEISPSFSYSLPSLDEAEIIQKPFNSNMPLLTEDIEEEIVDEKQTTQEEIPEVSESNIVENSSEENAIPPKILNSLIDGNAGLCSLGGEMCSSLSEPPPDMFDLSAVLSSHEINKSETSLDKELEEVKGLELVQETELKSDNAVENEAVSIESVNQETTSFTASPNALNDDSCEIPVQPDIVTSFENNSFEASPEANKMECEK